MRNALRVIAVLAACLLSAVAGGIFMNEMCRPTGVGMVAVVLSADTAS